MDQNQEATLRAYDTYAQVYDEEVIEFWSNFPKEFLERFKALLPGGRVLNVGSGSGRDALLLRELGLDVVCVDGSKSMVDMTRALSFESYHVDFTEIDFPAGSFSGIWAYTSLIHVPKAEAEKVVSNLRGLLTPGGAFTIGVIEGTDEGMIERKTMPGTARYFKNYTAPELKAMVEPLGFKFEFEVPYQPHNKVYLSQLYSLI